MAVFPAGELPRGQTGLAESPDVLGQDYYSDEEEEEEEEKEEETNDM